MRERDEKGRFVNGNGASRGHGRPPKEREDRYYEITMSACTFKDWEAIIKKAVDQAKRGDGVARKWLSDFLVGVPAQPITGGLQIIVDWDQANGNGNNNG